MNETSVQRARVPKLETKNDLRGAGELSENACREGKGDRARASRPRKLRPLHTYVRSGF